MPPRRSILSVPALSLLLTALFVPLAAPATAASSAASAPAKHCVLAAGATSATCYASFPAAIAAITNGRVKAPDVAATAATDPAFAAAVSADAATAASVITGVEYSDASYRGDTLTLYASGRCDNSTDADYVFNTLPAGWNDRITSFKSFNNCAQQLFRNTYRGGGALTGILVNTTNVGSVANDQASSLTAN